CERRHALSVLHLSRAQAPIITGSRQSQATSKSSCASTSSGLAFSRHPISRSMSGSRGPCHMVCRHRTDCMVADDNQLGPPTSFTKVWVGNEHACRSALLEEGLATLSTRFELARAMTAGDGGRAGSVLPSTQLFDSKRQTAFRSQCHGGV